MTVTTFTFDNTHRAASAFEAQCRGTDPYMPGCRSRILLAEILAGAIDVRSFVHEVRTYGAAILTGLPIDVDLPKTPKDGKRHPSKYSTVSEGLLNAVSYLLGMHPVAMHNEKDGDLIHQVAPVPGNETSISNQGAYLFQMHTEATHMDLPPDVLALVCVRNTERGATNFVSLSEAMYGASPELLEQLRRPAYTQLMGVSSGGGGRYTLPILSGTPDAPIYRVDFSDVEATDDASWAALAEFKDRVRLFEEVAVLQPGDLIVLNNHRALHGRIGFEPDYSLGKQRWLQRQYMTSQPFSGKRFDDRYPHVWHG